LAEEQIRQRCGRPDQDWQRTDNPKAPSKGSVIVRNNGSGDSVSVEVVRKNGLYRQSCMQLWKAVFSGG